MADEPNGADLGIDILGVKANVKNVKSLNTLATVATLVLTSTLFYISYTHSTEAKDNAREVAKELRESNKEVSNALRSSAKEQSTATRELVRSINVQNCLTVRIRPDMTPQQRNEEKEFCERITR